MVINQDNVFSETKAIVLDYLKDATNGLTDIQTPVRSRSKWILTHFPNRQSGRKSFKDFTGYPIVVVQPTIVPEVTGTFSEDTRTGSMVISVTHKGSTADAEVLANETMKRLQDGKPTFSTAGMKNLKIIDNGIQSDPMSESNFYQRDFALSWTYSERV